MGSRIQSNPKHVFDCFLEVVGPQGEGSQPWILQSFPPSYKDKETDKLKSVPQLTFFLSSVHSARLPLPGLVFHVQWGQNIFTASTPSSFHLPSIPDDRNLTEYFNAVDSNTMLIIFASMLYERRILITSRKLSRLSSCVQAANAL